MTLPRSSSPASAFAVALLDEFVRLGVTDIVVSPGSRSQALALAAARLDRAGLARLRVRIDERDAGFLALGLAVESRTPVLVITTSGTAVANLHPAVLEAHHSAVALIVLSADRPLSLRGIGSNQTTVQPGIFAGAVSRSWDIPAPTGGANEEHAAIALARGAFEAAVGPVHINLAFEEPLSGPVKPVTAMARPAEPPIELIALEDQASIAAGPGILVVAGHGAGPIAEATATKLGAPLIAEVTSGAHFGPNLVVAYRELLAKAEFVNGVKRLVVFGRPTLSREIAALIARAGVETTVVRLPGREDYNPGHRVTRFVDDINVTEGQNISAEERAWLGRWVSTSRALLEQDTAAEVQLAISDEPKDQAAFGRTLLTNLRAPVNRRALVEAAWRMTWPHDRLVFGASRLIRVADSVVPGKNIHVHSNRGLAGIDGTISTAVGIALASQAAASNDATGVTRVILGDLAFLHDVGGLAFGTAEVRPRIQVIIGNDGGGTMFDGLEVAGSAEKVDFDRVMLTRQQVSIEHLASAYGWEYRRVANRGELDAALTASAEPTIVEVPLARYPDEHD